EPTTPSVPFKGGFAASLDLGTFTPPFPRRGIRFPENYRNPPCPADELWVMVSLQKEGKTIATMVSLLIEPNVHTSSPRATLVRSRQSCLRSGRGYRNP